MERAITNEILSLIIVNYTMLFMVSLLIFYVAASVYKQWDIDINRMTVPDIQLNNDHKNIYIYSAKYYKATWYRSTR